jgi:ABC-type branched-subunit amino acid transport system substrate-binding protein
MEVDTVRVRTQLTPRNAAAIFLTVGALAVTAACGTRLPDKDFTLQAQNSPTQNGGTNPSGPSTGNTGGTQNGSSGGTQGTTGTKGSTSTSGGSSGSSGSGVSTGNLFAHACGGSKTTGNKSSDTGVTDNQITIGNIVSQTNPFGSDQFSPNKYGLIAFVQHCNAVGGINGRQIKIVPCNDGGQSSGNVSCVNNMIAQKAFSMVANNTFTYEGAKTAHDKGLLDIGGEPIKGAPYYTYDTKFNIYGDGYPKDNKNPGYKGKYWGTAELGAYMKQVYKISKVGVVYYAQADSQRGYNVLKAGLETQGISVHGHAVNLADPNYQAAVVDMQHEGDEAVFDAIDQAGNEQLCQAMNSYHYIPKAKVSTIAAWSDHVGTDFAPPCRDIVWSNGKSASYSDTSVPMVNQFREDFQRYGQGQTLAQWAVEGYIAGIWFAQAAHSCGSNLTRACVSKWIYSQKSMSAEGLMASDVNFQKKQFSTSKTERDCVEVTKWNQSKGGWDTLGAISKHCYTTHYYSYDLEG